MVLKIMEEDRGDEEKVIVVDVNIKFPERFFVNM